MFKRRSQAVKMVQERLLGLDRSTSITKEQKQTSTVGTYSKRSNARNLIVKAQVLKNGLGDVVSRHNLLHYYCRAAKKLACLHVREIFELHT